MLEFIIVSFDSTNFAMQAESVFKGEKIKHQVIPTPREITLSCGLSIRTEMENKDKIFDLYEEGKIKIKAVYRVSSSDKGRKIEKIEGR